MNTKMTKNGLKIAGLVAAFALTGCAFIPATVHPTYKAPAGMAKVAGAAQVSVAVNVINDRENKDVIGYTRDGYGFKTSDVYMNVKKDFTNALESALQMMGYNVNQNGDARLNVEVKKFDMKEKMPWITVNRYGLSESNVSVTSKNGKVFFHHVVEAKFKHTAEILGGLIDKAGRSKSAEKLLNNTVNAIVTQPGFNKALFEAAGVAQVTGATVSNNP